MKPTQDAKVAAAFLATDPHANSQKSCRLRSLQGVNALVHIPCTGAQKGDILPAYWLPQ